jgi:16S rRNA processing protein RimM
VLIPFVTEIVTEIDLDRQRAVITPPPGLVDHQDDRPAGTKDAP